MVPLNQSAKRAEFATVKLSPPKPNTSRPMNITGHDLMEIPKLKITCQKIALISWKYIPLPCHPYLITWPTVIRDTNRNKLARTPNLSTKYPPKKGRMTF